MRGISLWSHLQKSFVFVLLWPKKRPTKYYRSNVTLMSGNLSARCPTSNYFSSIHCVSIVCPYVYSLDWHHKIDTLLTFWRCHLADTCGNMSERMYNLNVHICWNEPMPTDGEIQTREYWILERTKEYSKTFSLSPNYRLYYVVHVALTYPNQVVLITTPGCQTFLF